MKCAICGKKITENIYVYKKTVVCYDCVLKECDKDFYNMMYIDLYQRNINKFVAVLNSYLNNYKDRRNNMIKKYNKTKNTMYWLDKMYYDRKIKELEELLK